MCTTFRLMSHGWRDISRVKSQMESLFVVDVVIVPIKNAHFPLSLDCATI